MLIGDFLREGVSRLASLYPAPEARNILHILCEERLGITRYTYVTEPSREIPADSLAGLKEDMDRLASGEPLQYVLGFEEFRGRRFKVTPDVLIPRPETEMLCVEAIKYGEELSRKRLSAGDSTPVRVLDLCTGSGCIAWTLALDLPGSVVYGVDISEKALAVASSQAPVPEPTEDPSPELVEGLVPELVEGLVPELAERLVPELVEGLVPELAEGLVPEPVEGPAFFQADILREPPAFLRRKFDLLLANPPYIMESQKAEMRPNVTEYEPSIALFVPDDDPLVFYRAIARWAKDLLSEDGLGIVEINESIGPGTKAVFEDSGFRNVELMDDFYGKNRFVRFS